MTQRTRLRIMRLLAAGVLIAAEMAVLTVFLVVGLVPAGASARPGRSLAPDFADAVPQQPTMLLGDSMADWLAYGPSRPSVTPGHRHPFNLVRLPRNPSGKMFWGLQRAFRHLEAGAAGHVGGKGDAIRALN
jgi:hypothetical protein